jgi:hypothetical protein
VPDELGQGFVERDGAVALGEFLASLGFIGVYDACDPEVGIRGEEDILKHVTHAGAKANNTNSH